MKDVSGVGKVIALAKAGIPVDGIVTSLGKAAHYDAQEFLRPYSFEKHQYVRALVSAVKSGNRKEMERLEIMYTCSVKI